ncbi:MAG: anhydro-N-acetylmuramic acid kinase [Kordiimonas sp.]|nr:anhydro-N-acetylmuramic acid kinase [Kordiimonas sp.]
MVWAIGLMSGTSLDGVDAAILDTDGVRAQRVGVPVFCPYTEEEQDILRQAIKVAIAHETPISQEPAIVEAKNIITERHIHSVNVLLDKNNITDSKIDVIGFHGQTVCHRPDMGWTWQLGDAERLAEETGIPVISALRQDDIAAGGQGAPLVPIYHQAMIQAADPQDAAAAVVNIGGVANVTWVGREGTDELIAFDVGPGNALLNDWIKFHTGAEYDRNGEIASRGQVNADLLAQMMKHSYFAQPIPKSLDRETFSNFLREDSVGALSLEDGAATLTAFTVAAIGHAARNFPALPEVWYICGGGAKNPYMMRQLANGLPGTVAPVEAIGGDSTFMEAEAFAYLAVRALRGKPITFPLTTGVPHAITGGTLYQP